MCGLSVGRPIPDRQLAGYLWRCAAIQNVTDFAGQEREAGTSQHSRDVCCAGAPGYRFCDRGTRGAASLGGSATALRMKPGGTVAVSTARVLCCSTFRLSKNCFTSASVP